MSLDFGFIIDKKVAAKKGREDCLDPSKILPIVKEVFGDSANIRDGKRYIRVSPTQVRMLFEEGDVCKLKKAMRQSGYQVEYSRSPKMRSRGNRRKEGCSVRYN